MSGRFYSLLNNNDDDDGMNTLTGADEVQI